MSGLNNEASKSLDLTIKYLDTVIMELHDMIGKLEHSVGSKGKIDWEA